MLKEFMEFLKQYNVLGLAVAVIIGGKLNEFIASLVNDLLMPAIFNPALKAAGVATISQLSYKGILYGKVIGAAIDFLVVAFIVFLIMKWAVKVGKPTKKA
ncbi:MAG: MscL family protein [Caldisericaceae bacterium]